MEVAYSHETLLQALEDMKKGENAFSVSKKYGIPRTTLIYKFNGKLPVDCKKGPAPKLGIEGEDMIKRWVLRLTTKGFPVTKNDLLTTVKQISKDMNLGHLFPNSCPGNKWLTLFLHRHPEISQRTVEKLSKVGAEVSDEFIRKWFHEIKEYAEQNNLKFLPIHLVYLTWTKTAFFCAQRVEKFLG